MTAPDEYLPARDRHRGHVHRRAAGDRAPGPDPAAIVSAPHGSGSSGRVGWGARPAVVVVDLVRAYTEPDGPFALPDVAPAVRAVGRLAGTARAAGVPVVWTVVRYAPGLADAGWFAVKVPALAAFAEDAPGGWGALALDPAPGETVLVKQQASAFHATSLAGTLTAVGVDTVVVAGVSTSGCVRATATDAIAHGFRPQVVAGACADRSDALHEANLADLDAKYADVVGVDDAVRALAASAGREAARGRPATSPRFGSGGR